MNERETLKINKKGHLEIGGMDTADIVKQFNTPVYVFDEKHIRDMMVTFRDAIMDHYQNNGLILYASKAFCCKAMYKIASQENIGVDVVSGGELYTALSVGFNPRRIYFHGNNKLKEELILALDNGVGTIVIDALSEANVINELARERGIVQDVLIRVNPAVEAHTHEFIQTARVDSKFGFSISDGTAEKAVAYLLPKSNLRLKGFHSHIGSQIFEKQAFVLAAQKLIAFVADIKSKLNFEAQTLNLGGGFGIWYTDDDPKFRFTDYREFVKCIISVIDEQTQKYNLNKPFLVLEPGRSIVGEAGITLYTVGAIKDIVGVRKYVSVDGGMFDNPRYALYRSKYTVICANKANDALTQRVTIAGKCCESGDIIGVDVALPSVEAGDTLAVLSTGAYNYSMSSNYNRNAVPPVIFVKDGKAEYVVKPQTYEDLVRNDQLPEYLT